MQTWQMDRTRGAGELESVKIGSGDYGALVILHESIILPI